MAKIGNIYLGGKESEIPESERFLSGITFPLKNEPEIDYTWQSHDSRWQVELSRGNANVVASGVPPLLGPPTMRDFPLSPLVD